MSEVFPAVLKEQLLCSLSNPQQEKSGTTKLSFFTQSKIGKVYKSCFPAKPIKKGFKVHQQGAEEYLLTATTASKRRCLLTAEWCESKQRWGWIINSWKKEGMLLLLFEWLSPLHSSHSVCSSLPHSPSLLSCICNPCAEMYLHLDWHTHFGSKFQDCFAVLYPVSSCSYTSVRQE